VDVLIDGRDLLEHARRRNLTLAITEKDYVMGWLLYGLSKIPNLVFKGGTALSKVYFPKTWRLSEDIDFSSTGMQTEITSELDKIFAIIKEKSDIRFKLKSKYSNPDYLQLKVQYAAILGKNWIKVDVRREAPLDQVSAKALKRVYSDYPAFAIKTASLEEIFAEKLRALIERSKCRDYYDVWKLTGLEVNPEKLRRIFRKKCDVKRIDFQKLDQFFPPGAAEILQPYWERELGRLVYPLPSLKNVLRGMKDRLDFLL